MQADEQKVEKVVDCDEQHVEWLVVGGVCVGEDDPDVIGNDVPRNELAHEEEQLAEVEANRRHY